MAVPTPTAMRDDTHGEVSPRSSGLEFNNAMSSPSTRRRGACAESVYAQWGMLGEDFAPNPILLPSPISREGTVSLMRNGTGGLHSDSLVAAPSTPAQIVIEMRSARSTVF